MHTEHGQTGRGDCHFLFLCCLLRLEELGCAEVGGWLSNLVDTTWEVAPTSWEGLAATALVEVVGCTEGEVTVAATSLGEVVRSK